MHVVRKGNHDLLEYEFLGYMCVVQMYVAYVC
jgi:hypothetical protein